MVLLPIFYGLYIEPNTVIVGFKITSNIELNVDKAKIDLPLFSLEYFNP